MNPHVLAKLRFADSTCRDGAGLLAVDREFRHVHWSAGMEAISGLSASDVLGRVAFEVFPFLAHSESERFLRQALLGKRNFLESGQYSVPGTGRRGTYSASFLPLEDDDGAIVGGVAVVRDITQEKRVHEQLRETENRFKNMADASPVLLWMSGTDSLCTFFNQTWLDFTGRSFEDEVGVGWAEGVHFEDFQRCIDTYLAAFNGRHVFEMEYRLRRRDGEYRWVLDRGTPRYTPEGTFAGYIGSCVDITERKEQEAELRNGVRARDEFLSIASHELRTPLTTLQLQVEALARGVNDGPEEALASGRLLRRARGAVDQVNRLGALIEELLDVSRLSMGAPVLDREEVDLAALARDVALRFEAAASAAGVRIDVLAETPTRGQWDGARLARVITNLIENAVKYCAGRPVQVSVNEENGLAVLRVRDEGPGIREEDQARIFERFERAVSSRHYGGFGLGLWIVRELTQAHGGRIEVASQPGRGATFTVSLPLVP
jgi:PAS domain S-box-containing protein